MRRLLIFVLAAGTFALTVALAVRPLESVAVTVAVCRPGFAKACSTSAPLACAPSSKAQARLTIASPGSGSLATAAKPAFFAAPLAGELSEALTLGARCPYS